MQTWGQAMIYIAAAVPERSCRQGLLPLQFLDRQQNLVQAGVCSGLAGAAREV